MKKLLITVLLTSLVLSACLPAATQGAGSPTPLSEADLQGTAAVLSQQTLQALPSATPVPSETPVVFTPTSTEVPATPTETQNPLLLTLTATLGTGTIAPENLTGTAGVSALVGTLPFTGTPGSTLNPLTQTTTPHPQFYGTLPPDLPYGVINLFNKSHVDAYISLRCVTKEGYVTILEYPVNRQVKAKAPAGKYTYVAWVGGRQFTGSFSLAKDDELLITLFKDKITIKKQ
ncbi:MAG: hypothetical protein DPW18_08530 [Chloroflexi bacterium]|nr:hypothetical protein [Chloroflexota bacterium]MDL1941820.1 hypothetical protein [Chloroflexi bacterium CFX2]